MNKKSDTNRKGWKIITAIKAFFENPYDGDTIEPLLEQMEGNKLKLLKELIYDRGGKGRRQVKGVTIITPDKHKAKQKPYQKRRKRDKCRVRAAIEPVLGHLKKDFRMEQDYLCGEKGIQVNVYLAAKAWNLKKMTEILKEDFLNYIFRWLLQRDKICFLT